MSYNTYIIDGYQCMQINITSHCLHIHISDREWKRDQGASSTSWIGFYIWGRCCMKADTKTSSTSKVWLADHQHMNHALISAIGVLSLSWLGSVQQPGPSCPEILNHRRCGENSPYRHDIETQALSAAAGLLQPWTLWFTSINIWYLIASCMKA